MSNVLVFLVGVDMTGAFGILFLLTGLGIGVFLIIRYILKRILKHSTEKKVLLVSLIAVWILVPIMILFSLRLLYSVDQEARLSDPLFDKNIENDSQFPGESTVLLDLEREAITREFKNDTTFLSSIMDSTFIELAGVRLKNKHQVLKTIFEANISNQRKGILLDSFRLEDPVVHLYDDNAAVVTFIMHTFRNKNGSHFERRTRFYDVWVRRGDAWKAVTWQASSVD